MICPRSLRAALAAAAGLLTVLLTVLVTVLVTGFAVAPAVASTSPAASVPMEPMEPVEGAGPLPAEAVATAEGDAPLVVTISSLNPSTLPRRGPVTVTGSVTNRDDAAWSAIHLYPFISELPMTTSAELAAAAASDPAELVGPRITARGPLDTIDTLAPGETASYSLRVRRAELGATAAGVYWFGVHALGERAGAARDDVFADGRARTLLPLVPERGEPLRTALVVPLRQRISFHDDGSLDEVDAWTETLGSGGRLRSLVDFGAAADGRPVNWLVDPALTDAAARLAAGNPPRSLAPTLAPDVQDDPDLAPTGSPSATPSPSRSGNGEDRADDDGAQPGEEVPGEQPGEEQEEPDPEERAAGQAAEAWLSRLRELVDRPGQVLALPYGDLDVPAAADLAPDFYDRARRRAGNTLAPWDVPTSPAVHPPSGQLDMAALDLTAPGDTVLVSDQMFRDPVPTVSSVNGKRLVVTSSGAASGGPGPDDRLAPVALRQRILAEAAVRRLSPRRDPLVVVFPGNWTPVPAGSFFDGLDVPWLRLTTVAEASSAAAAQAPPEAVLYPATQTRRQLDAGSFAAARGLIRAGAALQTVLSRNDRVAGAVTDEALTGVSYSQRGDAAAARQRAIRSRAWIERQLGSVEIEAPPQVTLSSASGRFSATITNNLDQPVTVGIDAVADQPIRIEAPATVELGPQSTRTVLLSATTRRQGVHNVTLMLTDADGTPLGSSAELPIRAALVSDAIWIVIGTGGVLLFGAIAVRLVRRVRRARGRAGAANEVAPAAGPSESAPRPRRSGVGG